MMAVPAWSGRYGTTIAAIFAGSSRPMTGGSTRTATRVAIAAAVPRSSQPNAEPSIATTVRYSAAPTTARSTPGAVRDTRHAGGAEDGLGADERRQGGGQRHREGDRGQGDGLAGLPGA